MKSESTGEHVSTSAGTVRVTRGFGEFVSGIFEDGIFNGQRAIRKHGGAFLPAGKFEPLTNVEKIVGIAHSLKVRA